MEHILCYTVSMNISKLVHPSALYTHVLFRRAWGLLCLKWKIFQKSFEHSKPASLGFFLAFTVHFETAMLSRDFYSLSNILGTIKPVFLRLQSFLVHSAVGLPRSPFQHHGLAVSSEQSLGKAHTRGAACAGWSLLITTHPRGLPLAFPLSQGVFRGNGSSWSTAAHSGGLEGSLLGSTENINSLLSFL